jgi:hypothetical protein
MIDATMIPDEAVEMVAEQFARSEHSMPLHCLSRIVQSRLRNNARAVLAAVLAAWAGAGVVATEDHSGRYPQLILPLPKENE